MNDKELAEKLKPELKKFDLSHEQLTSIAIAIKRNPQHLEECLQYLKNADAKTNGEDIETEIVNICY